MVRTRLAGMAPPSEPDRMKPARVLHLIDSLHLGGAQEVILTLVRGSDPAKFEHEVATLHGHGVYWDRMQAAGFTLHSLSPSKYIPLYIPNLIRLLRHGQFDLLHCHLGASNILGKPLARWLGLPAILSHDHTNDAQRIENRTVFLLDRWANRYADWFVAVSESCRNFLIQSEDIPEHKITLVANAIDSDHYRPGTIPRLEARQKFSLPPEAPVLAGVGRLTPQKNFLLFLDVVADLQREIPDLHILLAGTGPEDSLLRQHAASLGIADRVVFAGYVADSREVYAAADFLLMPSRFEGLPMTLLEAMSSGLPVVASALDGIAEVISSGADGVLAPPGDRDGFVRAVCELWRNASARKTMGQAARETIEARYSARRMVSQIEEIYARLLPASAR